MNIATITQPQCKKITAINTQNEEEEIVFTIQGIISLKDLPPIISQM